MPKQTRRSFVKNASFGIATISLADIPATKATDHSDATAFFTTGFKAAEVTPNSVTLWTRICAQETPNPIRHERREAIFRHPIGFDEDMEISAMDGGVKGGSGFAKAIVKGAGQRFESDWLLAESDHDFTVRTSFHNLKPGSNYTYTWIAKRTNSAQESSVSGTFTTAPADFVEADVKVVTSTCQYFWSYDDAHRGFKTYDAMRSLKPDFFVHTGDYVYYDKPGPLATSVAKARHQWHAMDAWPALTDFFRNVPIYMAKDDHDLLINDVHPAMPFYGDLAYEEGLKIWRENAPVSDKPYRTYRWGKHLQIWLMEGREYRSPNLAPNTANKTIWGEEQKKWLKFTMAESDATFKIVFSPTPIVGPDRDRKVDNHANKAYETEGKWAREYLSQQQNTFVVNGDRHWQYVSVDDKTGLTEFGSGPVSDFHAQGWDPNDVRPEHRFLRVKGGFLEIEVQSRDQNKPVLTFTHRDVDGGVVNEVSYAAS